MKVLKITLFVLLALNFLAPSLQSCTKDPSKTDNPALQVSLESLVKIYNKDVMFEHDKAIFMEGEMTVMALPSKEVLFFLKKAGESTNNVFFGQGLELSSMVQKELGRVKVAYLREAIAVETEDGEIYTFTIGERKGHELVQKLKPNWSGKGYGLAFNYNRQETPSDYKGLSSARELIRDRANPSSCECVDNYTLSPPTCTSGGTGSNSCSIGATVVNGVTTDPGCTVSCQTGYYSCCKAATQ